MIGALVLRGTQRFFVGRSLHRCGHDNNSFLPQRTSYAMNEVFMERYTDCPQILREFLSYHETIKGQSQRTIQEYYLDLRMFLRFMVLVKNEMPYTTALEDLSIRQVEKR